MTRKSIYGKNGKRMQSTVKGGWWRSCSRHSSGCSASTVLAKVEEQGVGSQDQGGHVQ